PTSALSLVLFYCPGSPRSLLSFPTRRSSDLDMGDVVHVEAAGGHVRGDQDVDLAVTERTQGSLTLALSQITVDGGGGDLGQSQRSEEHTSELQSRFDLVCRLLLEKKKKDNNI